MKAKTFHAYYDRPTKAWWGYWMDAAENQLGEAVFGATRDDVLIQLGGIQSSFD